MKKAVLMCMQFEHLEISPARYQLLEELSARGYKTYVFLNGHLKQKHKFPYVDRVINARKMKYKEIRKRIKDINPDVVIATTVHDTEAIYMLPWIMKDVKFYYYNLEIYTSFVSERIKKNNICLYLRKKFGYPANKMKEIIYTKKVKAFTIQDRLRKCLAAKYHIKHKNTILIPNSYVFDEAKISGMRGEGIVYTGGIAWWFMAESFADLAKVKNIPLTFSGWTDHSYDDHIKAFRETNPNIAFAIQQLPDDEYTEYIKQFAVGFASYSPAQGADEGDYYIGLASGKVFKYLSIGKPVIVMHCKGLDKEVRKHQLGIVINNIGELEDAYAKIMENYRFYQQNVIRAYKKFYDFRQAVKPLLDNIENI